MNIGGEARQVPVLPLPEAPANANMNANVAAAWSTRNRWLPAAAAPHPPASRPPLMRTLSQQEVLGPAGCFICRLQAHHAASSAPPSFPPAQTWPASHVSRERFRPSGGSSCTTQNRKPAPRPSLTSVGAGGGAGGGPKGGIVPASAAGRAGVRLGA